MCNAINRLGHQVLCKTEVPNELMLPKDRSKMARLMEEKCTIHCFVNKAVNSLLLDTGTQISLLSKHWLDQYHPDVEIEYVSSLFDEVDRQQIKH